MDLQNAIVWSDEAIIAVNKPAGLLSIRDGYDATLPYLAGMLEATFGQVWTIHRLDKETSGIILFARSAEAHRMISQQFMRRETSKDYHAIVIGAPEWQTITISLPLFTNGDRKHRTIIDHQRGKAAATQVAVIQTAGGFALLNASPRTGYTHQIRAHLAAMGFPLLADPLYKSLKPVTRLQETAYERSHTLPIQRVALHASRLSFCHPLSGQAVTLEAPYPVDFARTVEILFS